jgi:hypothetical protein
MTDFTPSYLEIDFLTLVGKFKDELKQSDIYRDYDFEGANITILMELMSYIGELTTYFTNKIAKNVFLETADIYEAANRLARQVGYEPKGVRAARATVTLNVSGSDIGVPLQTGDILRVLPWKEVNSGRLNVDDGNSIIYATTASVQVTASGPTVSFALPMRQGQVVDLENYSGDDLIDNELILPVDYAYDDDLTDIYPTVRVLISPSTGTQSTEWVRVSDFYLDLIPQVSDNVYMFIYDRYERSKIVFNSARNIPAPNDRINIRLLNTLGKDGSIGADGSEDSGSWQILDDQFIELIRGGASLGYINNEVISISLSAASIGAADPETITEIKFNSASALRAQFRDVTPNDYNSYLSSRSDVIRAAAWGEQDLSPSAGDPALYNLVFLSVIPQVWENNTIVTSAGMFWTDWGLSASTLVPISYNENWEDELLNYLAPRKMISAYEIFVVPDLVYFTFEIGVRIKRIFNFTEVSQDVYNKLIYYFRPENQLFNSEMDFKDVVEYLMDTTQVSPDDEFSNIRGIRNIDIRDINSNKVIYGNNSLLYPRWVDPPWVDRDNMLRPIIIGLNQFPILANDAVRIVQEY